MNSKYKIKYFFFFLPISLFFFPTLFANNEIFDKVIVAIGKQSLTQKELELSYKQLEQENLSKALPLLNQKQKAEHLKNLIYELLFVTGALQQRIVVSLKEINQEVEKFKINNKFSEQEFAQLLVFLNIDYNYFQEQFRRKIFVEKLLQIEIVQKIKINKNEIQKKYKQQYQEKETLYYLRHILKKGTTKAIKNELETIRKQARKNNNFQELAKEHSQDSATARLGGELPPLNKQDMLVTIAQAVENLKIGDISPPIKTPLGYHLFYLERTERPQGSYKLEQVERSIYQELYAEKYKNNLQEYRKKLQGKYKIVIKDNNLKELLTNYADFQF